MIKTQISHRSSNINLTHWNNIFRASGEKYYWFQIECAYDEWMSKADVPNRIIFLLFSLTFWDILRGIVNVCFRLTAAVDEGIFPCAPTHTLKSLHSPPNIQLIIDLSTGFIKRAKESARVSVWSRWGSKSRGFFCSNFMNKRSSEWVEERLNCELEKLKRKCEI